MYFCPSEIAVSFFNHVPLASGRALFGQITVALVPFTAPTFGGITMSGATVKNQE